MDEMGMRLPAVHGRKIGCMQSEEINQVSCMRVSVKDYKTDCIKIRTNLRNLTLNRSFNV